LRLRGMDWHLLQARWPVLGLSGVLLALHWWCFFEAVQRSTVGLGLLSFASYPAFVCLLGWCCLGERVTTLTMLACGLVVMGLALLGRASDFGSDLRTPL